MRLPKLHTRNGLGWEFRSILDNDTMGLIPWDMTVYILQSAARCSRGVR